MAGTLTLETVNTTTGFPGVFTSGVISRIEAEAYKLMYDEGVLPRLCKQIGGKGSAIVYPYFDPSAIAVAASNPSESTDLTYRYAVTNASVIFTASEFGITSFITDIVKEDASVDIPAETARQQGTAVAVRLEKHILARLAAGVTTGTLTGTNATNGFSFSSYAAAKSILDAKALTVPGRKSAVVPAYSWYLTAKSTYTQTYGAALPGVGEQVISKYYVTTLFGDIDVYLHGLAFVPASTTAAGFMFVKDSIGLWKPRDFRLETERDTSARGDEITSTMRAGAKVLHAGYIQRLAMYAAAPSTT